LGGGDEGVEGQGGDDVEVGCQGRKRGTLTSGGWWGDPTHKHLHHLHLNLAADRTVMDDAERGGGGGGGGGV
jgi:hypothetical protein